MTNVSSLAYRSKTLKSTAVETQMPYEIDFATYSSLKQKQGEICKKLRTYNSSALSNSRDQRSSMDEQSSMQKQLSQLKSKTSHIAKKYRAINNNWKNGITGVEQPGDHDQSMLYQEQVNKVNTFKKRHNNIIENRLKSKYRFLNYCLQICYQTKEHPTILSFINISSSRQIRKAK